MSVELRSTGLPVGVEVVGVDLAHGLDSEAFRQVETALNENGVVFLRNQRLTPEMLLDFGRRFGNLEKHVRQEYALHGYPEIHLISNVKEGERSVGSAYAGDDWHTDTCFMKEPSRCSLLYAKEVPIKDGNVLGDTEFCSAARAYETLTEDMRQRLAGLSAIFQYHRAQERKRQQREKDHARKELTPEQRAMTPDVTHPVIRTHPFSGRKCLYVNQTYTFGMVGMRDEEAEPLLRELCAHITRPQYVYRHKWQVGDLLLWDNCLTQHRAVTDYALPQRRLMHRVSVEGSKPF